MKKISPLLSALVVGIVPAFAAFAADPFSTFNPAHYAGVTAGYLDANVFLGNDVMPIKTLLKDGSWENGYQPKEGKNLAVATARLESGVAVNGWRIGYVARQEWVAKANRDSLDIYRASQLDQAFPLGKRSVYYEMDGWAGQGIQVGGAWRLPVSNAGWTVDVGATASLMKGQKMRREQWNGALDVQSANMGLISADISREFDTMEKNLLRIPLGFDPNPTGNIYSTDFGLSIGNELGLRVDWAVADLFGKQSWKDVPVDQLSATNYVYCQKIDVACGAAKTIYSSVPAGQVSRRDITYTLKPKQMFTVSLPVNQANIELGDSYRDGEHFPRIGVRQMMNREWGSRIDYDFRMKSVGLALAHKWLYLNYQTDNLRWDRARVAALGLGVHIPF